jgi:hypothetical protein
VWRKVAFPAAIFAALSIGHAAAQQAAQVDLRRWAFTLSGVRYHILLPRRATVTSDLDRFSASMSDRLVRQLHLRPAPSDLQGRYGRLERLTNGAVVRYDIEHYGGGGSGGPEAALLGMVEIGTRRLAVACFDQNEIARPDPEGCLQFLRYLELGEDK